MISSPPTPRMEAPRISRVCASIRIFMMPWVSDRNYRVRRLGVHRVEDGMNDLIAAHAEDGGAQDFASLRVDQDLHDALGFRSELPCTAPWRTSRRGWNE